MPKQEEDKNSICSTEEEEQIEVKDKDDDGEYDDDEDKEEDEDNDEEDDDEEDDDEDEDDENEEYDQNIINFELLKNFFIDEAGNNISTHLGAISKELRTLNKILLKKNKD
jgi:hypothetical protein